MSVELPPLPDVLTALAAEHEAPDTEFSMMSLHLTKTEHALIYHALTGLLGQMRGYTASTEREAIQRVIDAVGENVAGWDELKGMGL